MIAVTGILAYQKGYKVSIEKSQIKQKWRVDEVEW
jgi:tRNA A37 threonylcarbamoyltransferase TsaD